MTFSEPAEIRGIEVVVFDVLGTMVDEPGGLRAAVQEATGLPDAAVADEFVALWQQHCEQEQERVRQGSRPYASTEVLDAEAARLVAGRAGVTDPGAVALLATAGRRLPPWPDSAAGLERLARRFPVIGLSNAGRTALLHLNAHAGCAGIRPCPPRRPSPTNRRPRSTHSPSTAPGVRRSAC
jgi:2-haloacid dehalogenase